MTLTPHELIHEEVIHRLDQSEKGEEYLEDIVCESIESRYPLLSGEDKQLLSADVINDVLGYGFLEKLLDDSTVNEIMINSSDCIYTDRSGIFEKVETQVSAEELVRLAHKIAGTVGAKCDISSPILDAWLVDGSRVHVVLPPISPGSPCITIRRFVNKNLNLQSFCPNNTFLQAVRDLVSSRKNIVVAGSTSSGKTTLLNCMMDEIPVCERLISVEETAELSSVHPHWVKLISRKANSEGAGEISLGELVKATLRMRPDRIVVGEVRGIEAFDLMQALNTGHDGSLCTIHSNSPKEVISRLSSLALLAHPGLNIESVRTQFCYGIDSIIYVSRKADGSRKIDSISYLDSNSDRHRLIDFESGNISDV